MTMNRLAVQGTKFIGCLLVLNPLGSVLLSVTFRPGWLMSIGLVGISVVTAVVGYGMVTLRPWVLRVFPAWAPLYLAGIYLTYRAVDKPIEVAWFVTLMGLVWLVVMYLLARKSCGDTIR